MAPDIHVHSLPTCIYCTPIIIINRSFKSCKLTTILLSFIELVKHFAHLCDIVQLVQMDKYTIFSLHHHHHEPIAVHCHRSLTNFTPLGLNFEYKYQVCTFLCSSASLSIRRLVSLSARSYLLQYACISRLRRLHRQTVSFIFFWDCWQVRFVHDHYYESHRCFGKRISCESTCIATCRQCLQHKVARRFLCSITSLCVAVLALCTLPSSFFTNSNQWRRLRAVKASGLFSVESFLRPLKRNNYIFFLIWSYTLDYIINILKSTLN